MTEGYLQELRDKIINLGVPMVASEDCNIDYDDQLGLGGQMEVYGGMSRK